MKRLLFWNGRGNHNVLEVFLSGMSDTYSINFFPFEYDIGESMLFSGSEWNKWLKHNQYDIWCGISLGASMMYAMVSVDASICPREMVLINPFISRSQLSHEKGFPMGTQWEIELINKQIVVEKLSIVLSLRDEKIGIHHGIELLEQTSAQNKRLILLESDHCLSESKIQSSLAALFSGKEYSDDKIHQYRYIH